MNNIRTGQRVALDVTDGASVQAAVSEPTQREGRIDLLVNNAGLGITAEADTPESVAETLVRAALTDKALHKQFGMA